MNEVRNKLYRKSTSMFFMEQINYRKNEIAGQTAVKMKDSRNIVNTGSDS